ncbi:hypothetical protein [Candidatus Enterococcus mansonii]|uniref:SnoaL-like domain-containing protein n=1 Tax=Candidatus Enterococcus mansonii TaxID=1834181 RepID=A0A242CFJ7_9ENTE|nr:hypothetical protein [Enterococcus sp. 4G2_DIV0659]OTO08552.1 hypothetical protein A5880_001552 [Enterococcus sp. 4G2_DIV0659]
MDYSKYISLFWHEVAAQNKEKLADFFNEDAEIIWPNTNERFTKAEYLIANCDYPGSWVASVKKVDKIDNNHFISVTTVHLNDYSVSFYTISYFTFIEEKIANLEEYWSENGEAPQWRQDKKIGTPLL